MSIIKKMRKQDAVWWSRNPTADEFGSISFAAPVQIKCRWEDQEGDIVSKQDEIVPSMTVVYVDRDMKIGDKLKLGLLDTGTPPDPKEDRLAYEIQGWQKIPDLRAKEFLRIANL
jgi:hypothetical protein